MCLSGYVTVDYQGNLGFLSWNIKNHSNFSPQSLSNSARVGVALFCYFPIFSKFSKYWLPAEYHIIFDWCLHSWAAVTPVKFDRDTTYPTSNVKQMLTHLPLDKMATILQTIFFSCDQAALWMVQSVCLWRLFLYVPINVSSWNFQELLPMTKVMSMQKVKIRGQRSRSQRSKPNLGVSGP